MLFIDDNKTESIRLKMLFEITKNKLEKDVTFLSGFGFYGGNINWLEMLEYKIVSKQIPELLPKLKEYLELERKNPGCNMMCSVIDKFINKEFIPGLTLADEEYLKEYDIFKNKVLLLQKEIETLGWNMLKSKFLDDINYEIERNLDTDKNYPYEGIEI